MSNDLQLTELGKRTVGLTNHIDTLNSRIDKLTAQRDALRAACMAALCVIPIWPDEEKESHRISRRIRKEVKAALAFCDKEAKQ